MKDIIGTDVHVVMLPLDLDDGSVCMYYQTRSRILIGLLYGRAVQIRDKAPVYNYCSMIRDVKHQ